MTLKTLAIAGASALALTAIVAAAGPHSPRGTLGIASATVSLHGTTNMHDYTASTTRVELTTADVAPYGGDLWRLVERPSLVRSLAFVIPAASLMSPKDGIDKNMHKALEVEKFPHITFWLLKLETRPGTGALRATGTLTVHGVTRPVDFAIDVTAVGPDIEIRAEVPLEMTDFGIKPPKALLGLLRTDSTVTIRLTAVLSGVAS